MATTTEPALETPLCLPCFIATWHEEPDMGTGATWGPGECANGCGHGLIFAWDL